MRSDGVDTGYVVQAAHADGGGRPFRPRTGVPAVPGGEPAPSGPTVTAPVRRPRLLGVDATRGLALLGMMSVHSLFVANDDGTPSLSFAVSGGRSAAAFAVLAGVGIAFMSRRRRLRWGPEAAGTAASLAARALAIAVIGLALGWTDAEAASVILPYYAVLFLLAIPLLLLPTRVVAAVGVGVALLVPAVSLAVRDRLPEPFGVNLGPGELSDPLGLLSDLTLTGTYPALAWTAFICAGLAAGRLDLGSRRVAGSLLAAGAALAVVTSAVSRLALGALGGREALYAADSGGNAAAVDELLLFGAEGTTPTSSWWWLVTDAPHTGTPLWLLHSTGAALALLGAVLLLAGREGALSRVVAPVAAAGSMTLTLYTAHVLFLNSPLDVFPALAGYLVQVVVALAFAVSWQRARGRGPLESLVSGVAERARHLATRGSARGSR